VNRRPVVVPACSSTVLLELGLDDRPHMRALGRWTSRRRLAPFGVASEPRESPLRLLALGERAAAVGRIYPHRADQLVHGRTSRFATRSSVTRGRRRGRSMNRPVPRELEDSRSASPLGLPRRTALGRRTSQYIDCSLILSRHLWSSAVRPAGFSRARKTVERRVKAASSTCNAPAGPAGARRRLWRLLGTTVCFLERRATSPTLLS